MNSPYANEEPAEHRRFARYLKALEAVAEASEVELVAAVLRDEDAAMANSAVLRHLDRRAAGLLAGPRFTAWAQAVAEVIARREFLTLRLREWTLLHTIALGGSWDAESLAGASDWLQRKMTSTEAVTSVEALRVLAAQGRTRRVRHAARVRLQHTGRLD
ncbi:hypothetical protein ACFZCG_18575 [Streptomyces tanashiensis]|uniref:hypothetical protein n=1 Tax=Streptomyces tanashiensis TaxID=67367 RepID=UPI0036F12277